MSAGDEDLEARLEQLLAEEREVSALRSKLHERLASFPNEVAVQQERALSAQRQALHDEIDRLRGQLGDG